MAQAKECDRCGVLYRPYNTQIGEFNTVCKMRLSSYGELVHTGLKYELCPDCMSKFVSFLRNEQTEVTITIT